MNTTSPRLLAALLALGVSVFAQDSGNNLIPDGDFESGTLDRGWEAKCDASLAKALTPTLSLDSASAKSGKSSLKITVPPQENDNPTKIYTLWWRSPLASNIPTGSNLHIKGNLKLQKAAPLIKSDSYLALSITAAYTDGTKKWEVDPHGKFSPMVTDWQAVDFTWKAPKEIQSLTFCLVLPFSVSEVWLDNVSIQVTAP